QRTIRYTLPDTHGGQRSADIRYTPAQNNTKGSTGHVISEHVILQRRQAERQVKRESP
ncbi:hypothetical protein J6590_064206, partial [Homalodisca vitripennis]